MIRFISIVFVFLLVSACASTKNTSLNTALSNNFSGKYLAVTKRDAPQFCAVTNASLVTLGVLSSVTCLITGKNIVTNHNVQDPSIYIGNVLSKDFAAEFNLQTIAQSDDVLPSEGTNIGKIVTQYPGVDYLIDVRTVSWSFIPYTLSPKYRVLMTTKLRFIDVQQGTVIAEGLCKPPTSKKTDESPTFAKALKNEAIILKRELNILANECINMFKKNVLKLPETPLEVISLTE